MKRIKKFSLLEEPATNDSTMLITLSNESGPIAESCKEEDADFTISGKFINGVLVITDVKNKEPKP